MRKAIGIGIALLCLGLVAIPGVAAEHTTGNVDLNIRGGIGVHFTIANHKETSVTAEWEVTTPIGQSTQLTVVPSGVTINPMSLVIRVFSPVVVRLEAEGQQVSRIGYVVGVFVILR